MSRNVEKRVAELEFRNEQFEAAAKETMGTLEKLEEALSFKNAAKAATSGLSSIISTLNKFNPITNILSHITSAFETASKRISVGFFDRIGYDIENLSKKFIDFLGPEYIKTGFTKYESEIASIQKIINATGMATEDVMKYTEKLRWFTDETSYNYEDMINAIGSFTTAGVGIDDAVTSMIGIADAAGYFGVNATSASHAMSGFAQAIGKGYMESRSWQWIETAGMNTKAFTEALMDAAVAEGTLKKVSDGVYETLKGTEVTSANIKYTLKDQWLTTAALTKAFHKYGDATEEIYSKFQEYKDAEDERPTSEIIDEMSGSLDEVGLKAFRASQETKTFTDAIEYVRTAVASNWSRTWGIIIGNYDEAKEMWSAVAEDLYDLFVVSGQNRNALLERWKESNGRTELLASIRNFYEGIKAAVRPIKKAWEQLFPKTTSDKLVAMTKALNLMSQKFRAVFEDIADIFDPVVEAVNDFCDDISKRVSVVTEPVERTAELLDKLANAVIHGDYGNGQVRKEALQGLEYSYEEIQNRVNELLGSSFRYEITQQEIAEGAKEATEALAEENEELEEQLYQITDADSRVGRVKRTFAGLYAGALMGVEIFREGMTSIKEILATVKDEIAWPLVDWVLSLTSVLGDNILEIYRQGEAVESVKENIRNFTKNTNKWISVFANNFRTKIYPSIGPFFESIIELVKKNLPNLKKIAGSTLKLITGLASNLLKMLQPALPLLESLATFLVDKITWAIEKLAEKSPVITEKLGEAFEWVSEKVVTLATNVQELWNKFSISDAWKRLKTSLGGVKELFSDIGGIIHDAFFNLFGVSAGYDEDAMPGQAITRAMAPAPEAEDNKNKMLGFVEAVANGISDFAEKITAKKEEIKKFFELFTDNLANNIGIIGNAITNAANGMKSFGEQSWKGFTDILAKIDEMSSGSLSTISTSIQEFFGAITESVKKVDTEKLSSVFEGILKGGGMVALLNFSEGFANIGKNLGAVPATFNNLLLTAQETLLSYQKKINATNLEKIAKAIGILALSVVGLTFVDQDKLNNATAAIIGLGIVAAAIMKVAAPWIEAKAKLEGVKATAEQAKETQTMIADNGPAVLLSIFIQPLKDLATGLSNAARIWAGKHKISVFLVSVGITLTLIMNVLERIKEMQQDVENLRYALYNLAFIAGGLAVFALVMMWISRTYETMTEMEKGNQNFKRSSFGLSFSIALVAMAYSLGLIVKAIGEFAKLWKTYSYEQMTQSIGGMVIIMIGLGLLMLAASKLTNGFSVMATIIGLAAFLNFMVKPVEALGRLPEKEIQQGVYTLQQLIGFVAILIIVLAFAERLSGSAFFGLDIIAMSVGFMLLAGSMLIMANTLQTLAFFNWSELLAGIGKMALIIGALALLGLVLKQIPGMDESFGSLVKNILMFAVAAAVIGWAIPAIVDGLIYLGYAIEEHGPELAKGFATVIALILGAVIASKVKIVEAITTVLSSALEAFTGFIKGNGPMLVLAVLLVVNLLLTILEALVPGVIDKILVIIALAFENLAKSIVTRGWAIITALGHVLEALGTIIIRLATTLIKGWLEMFLGPVAGGALAEKFDNWITPMIEKGEVSLMGDIDESIDELKNNTENHIESAIEEIEESYSNKTGKFGEATEEAKEEIEKKGNGLFDIISDAAKKSFADAGVDMNNGFDNIQEIMSERGYSFSADQLISSLESDFDLTEIMENAGVDAIDALAISISANSDTPEDAAKEVAESTSDAGSEVLDDGGENGGKMYGYGAARGIRSTLDVVRSAAKEMGDAIIRSGNGALGVRSPSTKAFESGMYYDMGLANGINAYTYLATKASEDLSYKTVDSARNALYNVTQALNSDLDSTKPVITPVLDLSEVRGGLGNVSGMLDDTRLALRGASVSLSDNVRLTGENSKREQKSLFDSLRKEVSSLAGAIQDSSTTIEVPVNIDGREAARVIAPFARSEINKLDRNENRRNGRV